MATIRLSRINLYDRFPGPVNPNKGVPVDGWAKTCVTYPEYPVGEKRMGYTDNSHCPGTYTMMYGTLAAGSDTNFCVSEDFSNGKCWVAHCCLSEDVSYAGDPTYLMANPDGTTQPWHVMHRCTSLLETDLSSSGGAAIPCATMNGYDYGWFWVGGVCPCKDVTIMDESDTGAGCDMTTYGDIVAGGFHLCVTDYATWMIRDFSNAWEISIGGTTNAFTFAWPVVGWAAGPDA